MLKDLGKNEELLISSTKVDFDAVIILNFEIYL